MASSSRSSYRTNRGGVPVKGGRVVGDGGAIGRRAHQGCDDALTGGFSLRDDRVDDRPEPSWSMFHSDDSTVGTHGPTLGAIAQLSADCVRSTAASLAGSTARRTSGPGARAALTLTYRIQPDVEIRGHVRYVSVIRTDRFRVAGPASRVPAASRSRMN